MAFGSVSAQKVTGGKVVELVLVNLTILGEHPVLLVEHLGESNTEFWNDALAKANAEAHSVGKRKKKERLDAQAVAVGRAKNRETVSRYSVRDSRGFFHDIDGHPGYADKRKPATKADLKDIVMSLPDDVFDDVLQWVLDADNFREAAIEGDPKSLSEK